MQRKVITISKASTMREAVAKMIDTKTNGLVVVNNEQQVIGILSSWDVISYIVPDYLEQDKHLASFEAESLFATRVQELADHQVEQFMTKHVHTVKPTHSLMEAATLLAEHRIRQLPVVDDNGILTGYISRTNIKHGIGGVLGLAIPEEV